jgi:hypothetical protein
VSFLRFCSLTASLGRQCGRIFQKSFEVRLLPLGEGVEGRSVIGNQ